MPFVISVLLAGLIDIAGTLAGRVLVSLGFGAVTYAGLNTSLEFLRDAAVTQFAALPADILGMLGTMKVGSSISIVSSALLARLLLDGLSTGGSISKLVKKT